MKIAPPLIPNSLTDVTGDVFAAEATLEACRMADSDLVNVNARVISLDEVVLENVVLSGALLQKSASRDLVMANCDFVAAKCDESSFQRSTITNCRMSGADFSRTVFKDVVFTGCKLDMANFRFVKLASVRFENCVLMDTDFLGAGLAEVEFVNCTLERTSFLQCKLKNADFRSSQLIELKGWQDLKGAIIDSEQLMAVAPYLSYELGIKVID